MTAAASTLELPAASSLPALIDYAAWSKTGEGGGFERRYQQLLDAAAAEGGQGKTGGVAARLGLARFLVGSQLSFEAIGVLDLLGKTNQAMLGDAEFRGLRGAARAMAGRYKDAQADFSSPTLVEDPASSLWRGYVSAKLGDFPGAREQFARGHSAMALFAPEWRARFARMDAEAALASGDLGTARNELILASGAGTPNVTDQQAIQLTQAKLSEAENNAPQALKLYDQVAMSDYGALAAPAILRATQLRLAKGEIKPDAAVSALDSLRYRWRGDSTELDTVRALGHIYLQQGAWRQALEALRSAGQRSPDQPASVGVAIDLATAFRALFLDGQADGMQPIQALALFYDFPRSHPHRRRRRSDGAKNGQAAGLGGPSDPGVGASEVSGRSAAERSGEGAGRYRSGHHRHHGQTARGRARRSQRFAHHPFAHRLETPSAGSSKRGR